jgi:hypothetical protein
VADNDRNESSERSDAPETFDDLVVRVLGKAGEPDFWSLHGGTIIQTVQEPRASDRSDSTSPPTSERC